MRGLLTREDVIHFYVRSWLSANGWTLIAGEYPNGSDDQLHSLKVMDPFFSRDVSPDHRRHSLNKLVPDLVCYKDSEFLIIEMKPKYSKSDEEKLINLLDQRAKDLIRYLQVFIARYLPQLNIDYSDIKLTPALGFATGSPFPRVSGFVYLLVKDEKNVEMVRSEGRR